MVTESTTTSRVSSEHILRPSFITSTFSISNAVLYTSGICNSDQLPQNSNCPNTPKAIYRYHVTMIYPSASYNIVICYAYMMFSVPWLEKLTKFRNSGLSQPGLRLPSLNRTHSVGSMLTFVSGSKMSLRWSTPLMISSRVWGRLFCDIWKRNG